MKFRSRSSTCEANQWFPGKEVPGVFQQDFQYYVITIQNQKVFIKPGEWIITEPDGVHHYPCAPEVFEKRWERN